MYTFNYQTLAQEIKSKGWNNHQIVGMGTDGFITIKPSVQWGSKDVQVRHFQRIFNNYITRREAITNSTHYAQTSVKAINETQPTVGLVKQKMEHLNKKTHDTTGALIEYHEQEQKLFNTICNTRISQQKVIETFKKTYTTFKKDLTEAGHTGLQLSISSGDYLESLLNHLKMALSSDKSPGDHNEQRRKKLSTAIREAQEELDACKTVIDRWMKKTCLDNSASSTAAWKEKLPLSISGGIQKIAEESHGATAIVRQAEPELYVSGSEDEDEEDEETTALQRAPLLQECQMQGEDKHKRWKQGERLRNKIKQELSPTDQKLLDENEELITLLKLLTEREHKMSRDLSHQIHAASFYLGVHPDFPKFPLTTADEMAHLIMSGCFLGNYVSALTGEKPKIKTEELLNYIDQMKESLKQPHIQQKQLRRKK